MAKKLKKHELQSLRRRYAALAIRYRSFTSSMQVAMENVSYYNNMMENPQLTDSIKAMVEGRNKGIESIIRRLADARSEYSAHDADRIEQSLLWHEARFLSVAEAAQLCATQIRWGTKEGSSYRKFCTDYLELNQTLIARLDAIRLSTWFSPSDPGKHDYIERCTTDMRAVFVQNVERVTQELSMPDIVTDETELMRWAVRLRFTVRRYTEQVLDSLTIAPPIKAAKAEEADIPELRKRYAAYATGYCRLASSLMGADVYYAGSRRPKFREWAGEINASADAAILALAEAELATGDTGFRAMENILCLQILALRPLAKVVQLRPIETLHKGEETAERNKAYCVRHLKIANLLLHWLVTGGGKNAVAFSRAESLEFIQEDMDRFQHVLETHISRATDALGTPAFTLSRMQLGWDWHSELLEAAFQFAAGVMLKLSHGHSAHDGVAPAGISMPPAITADGGHKGALRTLH